MRMDSSVCSSQQRARWLRFLTASDGASITAASAHICLHRACIPACGARAGMFMAGWGASDGHGKRRLTGVTAAHAAAAAQSNSIWLEDCVIRLMCVLALDRFGDFVGDQVMSRTHVLANDMPGTTGTRSANRPWYEIVVQAPVVQQ